MSYLRKQYTILNLSLSTLLVFSLLACSGGKLTDDDSLQEQRKNKTGKLFGDIILGKKSPSEQASEQASDKPTDNNSTSTIVSDNVNVFLWNASLNSVISMPLLSVDKSNGLIMTDWFYPNDTPDFRFRINILVTSKTLRSNAIKAKVIKENLVSGQWIFQPVSVETNFALENLILQKARELRLSSLQISTK